ncbi:MAG: hypothetical protein OXC18_23610 [Desulfurellaceae bacterium]|nr:hypothetical protein [Desulfurellaceae bacterium]
MLASHFLEQHGAKLGKSGLTTTERALKSLQGYPWPGNIRELENVLERAVVLCREQAIDVHHLPQEILSSPDASPPRGATPQTRSVSLHTAVEHLERELIAEALAQTQGNKAQAAHRLEISERSLWYKVKKYGL